MKSNIGHLDAAAGVAGLIKTVLAVKYGKIPPSLHFEQPNQPLSLDRPRPYWDYIQWLRNQDLSEARAFWQEMLRGFKAPTPLILGLPPDSAVKPVERGEHEFSLVQQLTAELRSVASRGGLTLNTLLEGAWALLLSHYTGVSDIVFGTVVFGRPATLVGSDAMVGLFVNTLPARFQIPTEGLFFAWLRKIQSQQLEARQYEHTPLAQIQSWSELPPGKSLFASTWNFQNYAPIGTMLKEWTGSPAVEAIENRERTHYLLELVVGSGSPLPLRIAYDKGCFQERAILRVITDLKELLNVIVSQPEIEVAELRRRLDRVAAEEKIRHREERKNLNSELLHSLRPRLLDIPNSKTNEEAIDV